MTTTAVPNDGIELNTHPGGYYLAASLKDKSTADIGSELAFDLAINCEDLWGYASRLGSMHWPVVRSVSLPA